jgi:electron transport complex protein RnfG
MRDLVKMVVVLTVLSAFSGGLLAAVRNGTLEKIEKQQLEFVKGPAIRNILANASNDPINDRFKFPVGEKEETFFVGVIDGEPKAVVFETAGKGFGGPVGVMVGVDVTTDKLVGIGVTTHAETPGMGAKAKDEPHLANSFKGLLFTDELKIKTDGGQVDGISGATVTSRGIAAGVTEAGKMYKEIKPEIAEQLAQFK